MRLAVTALFAVVCLLGLDTNAAPGDLDPTFGIGGKVTMPNSNYGGFGNGVAIQPDGKIVVSSSHYSNSTGDFALVRFLANGNVDTSFNGTGKVITPVGDSAGTQDVVLQDDGKIVVSGSSRTGNNSDFALVRYNPDGGLDTSFNGTGKVTTSIGAAHDNGAKLAVQSDGKLIVVGSTSNAGQSDFALVRYLADGTLDATFNNTGKVITDFGGNEEGVGVAVQVDGRLVAVGTTTKVINTSEVAVARYLANGSLDTTFNGTGKVTTPVGALGTGTSVAVQGDGKIIVAGFSSVNDHTAPTFALLRYNIDGSLDTDFGNGTGKVITSIDNNDVCTNIALQSDGKIVAAGYCWIGSSATGFALVRHLADGSLDTSFNGTGKVITSIGGEAYGNDMALQSDGRIVVSGCAYNTATATYDPAIVRYEGGPFAPYEEWKMARLANVNAPDGGNEDADAFGNLVEYGLVLDPGEFSAGPLGGRFVYADGERLRTIFTRDPARNDVTIEAEAADELAGPWVTIASSVLGTATSGPGYFGGDGAGAGLKTVEVRDVVNLGDPAHPRRYLRLRVKR